MSNNKTNYWICDKCGEKIEKAEDGWVQWLEPYSESGIVGAKGLQIVHHVKCIYNADIAFKQGYIINDNSLETFQGPDGLMQFLRMLSDDEFADKEEVLEIIKRIFIPGYELARNYFDEAIYNNIFEPNTKEGYYYQNNISSTIEYINDR